MKCSSTVSFKVAACLPINGPRPSAPVIVRGTFVADVKRDDFPFYLRSCPGALTARQTTGLGGGGREDFPMEGGSGPLGA